MKKAPSDHNVRIVALRHNEDNGGVAIENFNHFPDAIQNNVSTICRNISRCLPLPCNYQGI